MKFTISKDQLLAPLQQIVSVIEKRQTMPILSNVLVVAKTGQVVLTGTDLEIQLVAALPVTITEPGHVTVPARKFLDICRLLPNGAEIRIDQQNDKLRLVSGRSRFVLSCLPADSYPEFSESGFDKRFVINAGQFKKALSKTVFCMANQDVRYYLNGLLLHISNSKIKLVASDGHRLAIYEDQLEAPSGLENKIIIPRKGVLELARLLSDADGELTVELSDNNIRIFIKNLVFSAKLVDSKYPDFSKVFHQTFLEPIQLQRNLFKDALTRVAILSNEKFKGITLDFAADSLKISTHNPEHDEAEEELPVDYSAEPLSISFNAVYVLDAIANLDSESALLTVAANTASCFIQEPAEPAYKFIVMPMKL